MVSYILNQNICLNYVIHKSLFYNGDLKCQPGVHVLDPLLKSNVLQFSPSFCVWRFAKSFNIKSLLYYNIISYNIFHIPFFEYAVLYVT